MDGLTDRFFADVDNIKQMNDPSTHLSYREFLAFFQQKAILAEHDVVIGAYFTYGWMPTILKKLSEPLQAVVEIANLVKSSQQITDAQFKQVASAINGSVVGASKFLHFINPETHAIWDSRVFRYLHQKEPYPERLVAPGAYWNYLRCLDAVARDQRFQKAKTLVETVVGYTVTNKRAAELVMYHNGKP